MVCKKCGTNNIEGSTFCMRCGSSLNEVNQTNNNFNISYISSEQQINNINNEQSVNKMNDLLKPQSSIDIPVNSDNNKINYYDGQAMNINLEQDNLNMYQQINNNQTPLQYNRTNDNYQQYQTQYPTQSNTLKETKHKKKKIGLKIVIIIALVILLFLIIKIFISKDNISYEPIIVNSTFVYSDGNYVLKSKDEKILLDGIKSHGEFCNGTTYVKNKDGQYGIIDGNGKFFVDYGKYKNIDQYHAFFGFYSCFYKAKSNDSQYLILKYNGNILYYDPNDQYLLDAKLNLYDNINKFAMLETKEKYDFYSYLGNKFASFDKTDNSIKIYSNDYNGKDYIAIYYKNKSYIYSLKNFKQYLKTFDGLFYVNDIQEISSSVTIAGIEFKDNDFYSIVFGYPDANNEDNTKTYVYRKNKKLFEINNCSNAIFLNGGVRCSKYPKDEYYDLNGNRMEK